MNKILDEHSKSINEIYNFIALIEDYIKDLDKRIYRLESKEEYNKDYDNEL